MKTGLLLILTLSAGVVLLSCGGSGSDHITPAPTLASIQISTNSTTVPLGGTRSLTVIGSYSDGTTHDFTDKVSWASSSASIATVSALGDVTGVSKGSAVITATMNTLTDTIDLTVGDAEVSRSDISPSAPSTPANTTQQLVALGRYTDGTAREVNDLVAWTSSDDSKVTISATGLATALASGTATVTSTVTTSSGTVSGSASMVVSTALLVRIAVLPYQPVTGLGVVHRFVALGTFDDYSTHELVSATWSSSNTAIASTTADGVVSPLQSGSTTITAKVGATEGSTVLTILPAKLVTVVVSPATASVPASTGQQFTAEGILADGSMVELPVVDWSSNNGSVAAINSSGWALAAAPGSVTVSASVGGVTGSSNLSVTGATLETIAVAPAVPSVPILSRKQLHAVGKFNDGTSIDITPVALWWTNDPRIVTVSKLGLASSNATGSTTIAASLGNTRGSTTLQVSSLTVDSVEVQPANVTLPQGAKLQYSLFSNLSDGSKKVLDAPRWFTSPITMATTTLAGIVTARTPGIGKIYGETCCKTAYTQLTVTKARAVSLAIDPDDASVPRGAAQALKAFATFDDGSVVDVSNAVHWTSSQPTLTLVDRSGTAVAAAQGKATIAAMYGSVDGGSQTVTTTTTLTVTADSLTALTVTPGNAPLVLGDCQQFTAMGTFSDLSVHPVPGVVWHSSDPTVAIVLPSGMIMSTGTGTAVITATAGAVQANATITVQ